MISFKQFIVAFLIGLATSSVVAKFCPREKRDGFQCRAKDDQFKCGIFFEDLLGTGEIKWIGALPDAIAKTKRKNPELVNKIFPKVDGQPVQISYFRQWSDQCNADEANAKCYLLMDQIADDRLDSCKKTVGNLNGDDTIGNQLCGQAKRFLRQNGKSIADGMKDQPIAFFSSTCQGAWSPVGSSQTGNLRAEERLCCDSSWKYYKCDGGDFRNSC
eukprot:TRINITY_DN3627_c0_g1_i10.p1 TRINITY_DN3627_c0_g1~~TRINITY_DN3627_c0_g1_i10.p1  ORF type:complete len:216 (-),score=40.17 TRINITY_DN3627_c0_g1_i10:245-892(-)